MDGDGDGWWAGWGVAGRAKGSIELEACSQRARGAKMPPMTAKELLLQEAPQWTEHDAEVALRAVKHEHEDPMIAAFRDAPEDDEPLTAEEEAGLEESHADLAAGRTFSLEEIKRDLDLA